MARLEPLSTDDAVAKEYVWVSFFRLVIASLTFLPIVTIRGASVAAVLSFHRIATEDFCFIL